MSELNPTTDQNPAAAPLRDRRAYVRLASDLATTSRPVGHSREVGWPGRVRDISLGGVGLLMRHRFRPGTILEVELRANTGTLLRTVSVRVIHATAVLMDGNPCWLLGCAFPKPLSEEEFRELC